MAVKRVERQSAVLQTTDAGSAVILSYSMPDESVVHFNATIVALKSTGSTAAGYELHNTYRRTGGGAATEVGAHTKYDEHEDDVTWDVSDAASGAFINIKVTGAASTTINWWLEGYGHIYTP